jgi:hypothetical protein
MDRRRFLVGTAAGAAALAGLNIAGRAQERARGGQAAGARQGGAPGRGRGPADVPAWKLARVSIMTYNYNNIIKTPWQEASPTRTLDVFDIPQYYVDMYGVHNVEFQHSHVGQNRLPDLDVFRQMRAKLDAVKSIATQINIETGNLGGMTPDASAAWIENTKQWVDAAPILGVKRLMLNQGTLNEETKASVIATWKAAVDYAKPKGVMISAETRGGGGGRAGADGVAPPPAWILLEECIEAAGGHSNIDIGGAAAPDQASLNAAIKGMFPTSSGNMHIKSSTNWDIGAAVRYTESLGYKGRYSIEVNQDPAIRIVYNTILANVTNQGLDA